MDKVVGFERKSITRINRVERERSRSQREADQIALLNWLLEFQHTDALRLLDPVVPQQIKKAKPGAGTFVLPKGVREAVRSQLLNQSLDYTRERLQSLHRAQVGGVIGTGTAEQLSRLGIQRFHAWWRDVCERVLNGEQTDQIDEIRLPPVTPVLRVYWRAERADLARWPHTLKLQSVALLLKYRDRIRLCPALIERGQAQCGRPFVRVRRQLHCSVTCAQRERSREWYDGNLRKTPRQESRHGEAKTKGR